MTSRYIERILREQQRYAEIAAVEAEKRRKAQQEYKDREKRKRDREQFESELNKALSKHSKRR